MSIRWSLAAIIIVSRLRLRVLPVERHSRCFRQCPATSCDDGIDAAAKAGSGTTRS